MEYDGPAKKALRVSSRSTYTITHEDVSDVTLKALRELYQSLPCAIREWISIQDVYDTHTDLRSHMRARQVDILQRTHDNQKYVSYSDVRKVRDFLTHAIISPLDKGRGLLCIC